MEGSLMEWWSVAIRMRHDLDGESETWESLLDRLTPHAAVLSIGHDAVTIRLSIEAALAEEAVGRSVALVASAAAELLDTSGIIEAAAMTHDELERQLREPSIPPLASVVEIGEMAGVSRQRADQIAALAGFPAPVLETRVGRLWARAAVEHWLERWERKPGRPRRIAGAAT